MHLVEIKAKVKSGKENELNQVLKDLVPHFHSLDNITTQVHFNEQNGELNFKLSNGGTSKKIKEIITNKNFTLFIGSIKVLCDGYTLIVPQEQRLNYNLTLLTKRVH